MYHISILLRRRIELTSIKYTCLILYSTFYNACWLIFYNYFNKSKNAAHTSFISLTHTSSTHRLDSFYPIIQFFSVINLDILRSSLIYDWYLSYLEVIGRRMFFFTIRFWLQHWRSHGSWQHYTLISSLS